MLKISDYIKRKIFSKRVSFFFCIHLFAFFILLGQYSAILSMEKNVNRNSASIDVTKLDKDGKKVLLNILGMTDTFVKNSQHMLRFLKKIEKHASCAIAPDAEETEYLTVPFELPGEEACTIRCVDAALKYKMISDDSADETYYIKNDTDTQKVNNNKKLDYLLYKNVNVLKSKKFLSGKVLPKIIFGYQFFGKSTVGFFADSNDIKIFNQQYLHPNSLFYLLKNKQKIKNGIKPVKTNFQNGIDQAIYHYTSLLYAFEKLLDFECQVPLYNLVTFDSYLNTNRITSKNAGDVLKTFCLKEHYFQQFIPLLAMPHPTVYDYTSCDYTKSSSNDAKISDQKIEKALQLLGDHGKTIAYFDTIHNAVFRLCFTMYKTRSIPTNLSDIILSIENKLTCMLAEPEKYIDPLYCLYENLYSENTLKYIGFWGPRLFQKTNYLPEKIFSIHVSSELREKIALIKQQDEIDKRNGAMAADKAAAELLAECEEETRFDKEKKLKNYKQVKNSSKGLKSNDHAKKPANHKNKKIAVQKKTNISLKETGKPVATKKIIQSKQASTKSEQPDFVTMTINSTMPTQKTDIIHEPCLLFNKKYFERLSDRQNKELYDHYHGVPGKMIYDIIHNGTVMPLPTDSTAKVFFGVAAVKTVLIRYLYCVPIIITDKDGLIFHVGLHKEENATNKIGNIVSQKIKNLQNLINWPPIEVDTKIQNNKKDVVSAPLVVPNNGLAVSLKEFNNTFPCFEKPSDYSQAITYVLPNDEELIFLNTHAQL